MANRIKGITVEIGGDTTKLQTALGILANNGIKGAEGGTHLRNVILSLQNPTDGARKTMESLGVSVYDSEGNMRMERCIFRTSCIYARQIYADCLRR